MLPITYSYYYDRSLVAPLSTVTGNHPDTSITVGWICSTRPVISPSRDRSCKESLWPNWKPLSWMAWPRLYAMMRLILLVIIITMMIVTVRASKNSCHAWKWSFKKWHAKIPFALPWTLSLRFCFRLLLSMLLLPKTTLATRKKATKRKVARTPSRFFYLSVIVPNNNPP